jgi:hypothetical protein
MEPSWFERLQKDRRAYREAYFGGRSEVWIHVYGRDGTPLFPEPRRVAVPADFLDTGHLPTNIRVKRLFVWIGVWGAPMAGCGVNYRDAASDDEFICGCEFDGVHGRPEFYPDDVICDLAHLTVG